MKHIAVLALAALIGVGCGDLQAGESLWCQVKNGKGLGASQADPGKQTPFVWSSSHAAEEHPTGPIRTSIGLIAHGDTASRITLVGKAVPLPAAA